MSLTQNALLEIHTALPSDNGPSINSGVMVRCRYSKIGRNCLMFVIADMHPDGREEFTDQESGELCWYPFTPCPAERAAVHAGLLNGFFQGGWPLLTFVGAQYVE